ncbi:MAG: hypothetical protein ACJAZT_000124 [Gammaproteobacteria bacterium]|jgi:hypothetical protein
MNQESGTKDVQAIYPQYINTYEQQDEISLVDLWIALLKFKKVYLWSFIFSIMVGISAVTLLSTPKYTMTTTLKIADYNLTPIESPELVISRINSLILPEMARAALKANIRASFKADVSNPKGTNLIVIESKVLKNQVDVYSDFHSRLGARIINAHQDLLFKRNSDLRKQIVIEEKFSLEPLALDAYMKKFHSELTTSINQLDNTIKSLTDKKVQEQSKTDPEALARMMLINQEAGILIDQKISLVKSVTVYYNQYMAKSEKGERTLLELKDKFQNELSNIITQSEVSREPINRSKSVLYFIVILLSLFLAFAFTLIAMFRAKVIERLAEKAKQ